MCLVVSDLRVRCTHTKLRHHMRFCFENPHAAAAKGTRGRELMRKRFSPSAVKDVHAVARVSSPRTIGRIDERLGAELSRRSALTCST